MEDISQLILGMIFLIVYPIVMIVLKLKYKKQFNFGEAFKISVIVGLIISTVITIISVIIIGATGLEMKYPMETAFASIGTIVGFTIGCGILGVIIYAIARYVIITPIKKITNLKKA